MKTEQEHTCEKCGKPEYSIRKLEEDEEKTVMACHQAKY